MFHIISGWMLGTNEGAYTSYQSSGFKVQVQTLIPMVVLCYVDPGTAIRIPMEDLS